MQQLSDTNTIHPTAVISGDVVMGSGNIVEPYAVIQGPVTIGDGNVICPHATIGSRAATRKARVCSDEARITIGNDNTIREYVSVQEPANTELTSIGSGTYLMQGIHLAHDACIEDDVTITANVGLGGDCTIMKGANIGLNSALHQKSIVGSYAMIGAGSTIVKNVRPFTKFITGRPLGVNSYALTLLGIADCEDECARYIREGVMPENQLLLGIVERFARVQAESDRSVY